MEAKEYNELHNLQINILTMEVIKTNIDGVLVLYPVIFVSAAA